MAKQGIDIDTKVMDHHGLIAAQCKELRLAQRLDKRLQGSPTRIVSYGRACVAMILNGLGFANRSLYLTPQFFESKPVQLLLDADIEARHLNDDTLGDALDAIADYGPEQLFGEVAFEIALEHNLLGRLMHVDTTSFSVHGAYKNSHAAAAQTDEPANIHLTHGFSKDHRPDLKQVVLSLAMTSGSCIPLWMTPCDGNASDKNVLLQTAQRITTFSQQLDTQSRWRYVADAALYTKKNLDKMRHIKWVSRVPQTVAQAQELVERDTQEIAWIEEKDGYRHARFESQYGNVTQRWLLVFSQQAYEREAKTWHKQIDKQEQDLIKQTNKLRNQVFACEADARQAVEQMQKNQPYFKLEARVETIKKYAKAGRPKAAASPQNLGYQVQVMVMRCQEAIDKQLRSKGRFILASNDCDDQTYSDEQLLADYKAQQTVEHGFRFLKNPDFMADTLFLKTPRRIAALMMIMTLCLMVYNLAQHRLRKQLQETNQTLPNQLGKASNKPTLRWIFQMMEGIALARIFDHTKTLIHQTVSNLSELRIKIIRLFGNAACKIYGLALEGGGM
jgi:transposase